MVYTLNMTTRIKTELFLKELEMEAAATRKCLERIPASLYKYKPHEKSMELGYLTLLVAEIPSWITAMIEVGEIDFATFSHEAIESSESMVALFDKSMEGVRAALQNTDDEKLLETFELKNSGHVLMSDPKDFSILSTINHLVHHRGQLTVYMRLNDIAVPSIYGPSADEKGF